MIESSLNLIFCRFVVIQLRFRPSPSKAAKYPCSKSYSLFVKLNCWHQFIIKVYETVHHILMKYECMLFRCTKVHFQLVTALIVALPPCAHTSTCDGRSQYITDEFYSWACFFYAVIEFGFGVYFLISG